MTDWFSQYRTLEEANEAAMASVEREQRKISELTRQMEENTTTVRSKDRSFTIDFDGRGEITGFNFVGTKYRTMAPAEFSHLLVQTIKAGKALCMQKLADSMGDEVLPGVTFTDLASGNLSVEEVFEKVVSPFLGEEYSDGILGRPAAGEKEEKRNG
ncbi:hypothetical protein ACWEIJ_21125 [Lentzea sp. NPDC004789]